MAVDNYVRDLSTYLAGGNFSDLTLEFGDRVWRVHKALICCHSNWFRTAITKGFKEATSETIRLQDEPYFENAIDCMVSYFYGAKYDAAQYKTTQALLHAQVVTIADKYECHSLCKFAKACFNQSMDSVRETEWAEIAAFVYSYTPAVDSVHVKLQHSIVTALTDQHFALKPVLRNEDFVEMLHSNAELAIELLLHGPTGPKSRHSVDYIFICDLCHFAHSGAASCSHTATISQGPNGAILCPRCSGANASTAKKYTHRVQSYRAIACPGCGGVQTAPEEQQEMEVQG